MTKKLFYSDPAAVSFVATVLQILPHTEQRWRVVLDQTLFYPESGGQPADRGTIAGLDVLDVQEDSGRIIHIVDQEPPPVGQSIQGEIDWPRRLDHMQQHSGQHLLSALFEQQHQAATLSIHIGEASAQIDLDKPELTWNDCLQIERMANEFVSADLPIEASLSTYDQALTLPLRKQPPQTDEPLRIVEITGIDHSCCCGTHVAQTSKIGPIKLTGAEKKAGALRLDFLCGWRALNDYETKNELLKTVGRSLSAAPSKIPAALAALLQRQEELQAELAALQLERREMQAIQLAATAERCGSYRLALQSYDNLKPGELSLLAKRLQQFAGLVSLLGSHDCSTAKFHFVFAAAPDVPLNLNPHLKTALTSIDGKGGGAPSFVQGGGAAAYDIDSLLATVATDVKVALDRQPSNG